MDENHQNRHRKAVVNMIAAYGLIMKVLGFLPLPIGIPSLRDSLYAGEVETGLIRAYQALHDLPMDEEAKRFTGQMILDWIAASDVMFRDEEEEASWHLDLVEIQVARILAAADLVQEILNRDADRD